MTHRFKNHLKKKTAIKILDFFSYKAAEYVLYYDTSVISCTFFVC